MAGWASVWVARGMHDRAAWLLKFPPVSEAELEYLATGELPVAKPDPPGSDASA